MNRSSQSQEEYMNKRLNLFNQKKYYEEKLEEVAKFIESTIQGNREINFDMYTTKDEVPSGGMGMEGFMTMVGGMGTRTVVDNEFTMEMDEVDSALFLHAIYSTMQKRINQINQIIYESDRQLSGV